MEWITASAKVVDAIGTPTFTEVLIHALRQVVPFEFSVVFAYYKDAKPIDLYDDFSKSKRRVMVHDYQEGPYLLDPLYQHSTPLREPRLVRLKDLAPDRFYQSEYFRNYYVQTGLAEEIGFMVDVGDEVSIVISAMREHKVFSVREFRDLERLFPFVQACARKHWKGLINSFADQPETDGPKLSQLIDKAFQSVGGNLLTPREAEVVEFALKGYSAEATGKSLGISPGTVRIHRRNIYGKLQIRSQGELFSLFISTLSTLS